jgi:parvulin-like peptidyl-prolyl isomerase
MKKARKPRKHRKKSTLPIVLIIFIVAALLVAGFAAWYLAKEPEPEYAAVVNGKEITKQQFAFQYGLLPESYRSTFTVDDVLNQIIEEELIVQVAKQQKINVSKQDVNERVQQIIAQNQITAQELNANLAQLNITPEQFEELVERQLLIDRYLTANIIVPEPDDTTLEGIYARSIDEFAVDEQVTVRHVLVSLQRPDAALIAKRIYDAARNGTNFCQLVENASDDRGSRELCGEYTFPRNYMVQEFEKASFDMENGEFRMIQTEFGYHVIEKINSTVASVRPFATVRNTILAQYMATEKSRIQRQLIGELRARSTIKFSNGTIILPMRGSTISAGNELPVVNESLFEANATKEPVIDSATNSTTGVLSCIAARAELFGTSWSTDVQESRRMFSANGIPLRYTACDKVACPGITAYPTWVIGEQKLLGKMTIEELQLATDC